MHSSSPGWRPPASPGRHRCVTQGEAARLCAAPSSLYCAPQAPLPRCTAGTRGRPRHHGHCRRPTLHPRQRRARTPASVSLPRSGGETLGRHCRPAAAPSARPEVPAGRVPSLQETPPSPLPHHVVGGGSPATSAALSAAHFAACHRPAARH